MEVQWFFLERDETQIVLKFPNFFVEAHQTRNNRDSRTVYFFLLWTVQQKQSVNGQVE